MAADAIARAANAGVLPDSGKIPVFGPVSPKPGSSVGTYGSKTVVVLKIESPIVKGL